MMKSKRIILIMLCFITLVGCAGNAQVINENRFPDLVLFTATGEEGAILAQVVNTFEKQEGITVTILNASAVDFTSQLWASLLSKSNQWDAVMVPTGMIPQMVDYKGIIPYEIPDPPQETGQDPVVVGMARAAQDVMVDGKGYGLPIQYDVPVLIYRKDILDQQKMTPPQDWQSLMSTVKALKQIPGVHANPYVVAPGDGSGGFDFAIYLVGFGGSFIDQGSQVILDDATGRQAFSYYIQMFRTAARASPEAVNWGPAAATDQFRSGSAIMGIVWLSDAASLMDCKQTSQVCADGKTKFALRPIPGIKQQDGRLKRFYLRREKSWVIPGNAHHLQAAQSWLDWLASDEGRLAWEKAGGVPFNLWASLPKGSEDERPDLAFISTAMLESVGMPIVVDQEGFWAPVHEMVSDAATGKKTSDQALEDAAQEIRAFLIREGNP